MSITIKVKSPPKILNKAGKERRSVGKVLNLAATYGMGGATAGARLGKSREEGEELLNNFFRGFPKVKEAIEQSKEFLKERGYVEDFLGRRRHLPEVYLPDYEIKLKDYKNDDANFNPIIGCGNRVVKDPKISLWEARIAETIQKNNSYMLSKDPTAVPKTELSNKAFEKISKDALADGVIVTANTGRKAQAGRQCFNSRVQGSAATLTKLAMIGIADDKELTDCQAQLIIPVHDELLVECPEYYADRVEARLPQVMVEAAAPYIKEIPMKCDPYNVTRWYIDEYSAAVKEDYKKLLKTESQENAKKQIKEKYCEIPEVAIDDLLSGKSEELEF